MNSTLDIQAGNPNKAGLENVDKTEVSRKINELSKGSKFYENEERKDKKHQEKISDLLDKHSRLTQTELSLHLIQADKLIQQMEDTRDFSKTIIHIDMDAFYCAVEERDNPALKHKPIAVGGMGMLCTANYVARKYGVRAAMPGFIGKELCPDLILVSPSFDKYKKTSEDVQAVLKLYDPNYDMMSLDEAYLDITDYMRVNRNTASEVVETIREHITFKTTLTASAGIAANRLLAKICSDINKPNGQYLLESDRSKILEFIESVPVRKIPGIGKVTEKFLKALNIDTCLQLYQNRAYIHALFTPVSTEFLLRVSRGIGSNLVGLEWNRKSMSTERTFEPTDNQDFLHEKLVELSQSLSNDLTSSCLRGKTITLKIKTDDFQIRTRSKTLMKFCSSEKDIFNHSLALMEAELPFKARLLGVKMSSLEEDKPSDMEIYISEVKNIDEDTRRQFTCPLCNLYISRQDNFKFNQHIDICLNKDTVTTVSREINSDVSVGSSSNRLSNSSSTATTNKKTKRVSVGGTTRAKATQPLNDVRQRTLDMYIIKKD